MARHDLPILILAAGASSRMRGADKLLQDVDGIPLLRQQALKARAATTGPVIVALPAAPHPRYAVLDDLQVQLVPVPDASEGMNASLRRVFAALPPQTQHAMLLLADLPDLTTDDLARVADAVAQHLGSVVWRGVTEDGAPGHPIVFDASLFDRFQALRGDGGGQEVIKAAKGRITHVPLSGQRARNDLDTPEDWDRWRTERDSKETG